MSNNKTVNEVDVENMNFEPVKQEFLKFHDFKKTPKMVGEYLEPYRYENEEKKQLITGFKFKDKEGFEFLVNESYQIAKAIEENGETWYSIEFTGFTPLDGGRKVNNYKIAAVKSLK